MAVKIAKYNQDIHAIQLDLFVLRFLVNAETLLEKLVNNVIMVITQAVITVKQEKDGHVLAVSYRLQLAIKMFNVEITTINLHSEKLVKMVTQ